MPSVLRSALSGVAAVWLLFAAGAAGAQEPADLPAYTREEEAEIERLGAVLDGLTPQWGDVSLQGAPATLYLGETYYFLGPEDARTVLTEWGNPPESAQDVLGMVFPAGKTFLDQTWAAVVTYEDSGHVDDSEAGSVDYDALLKSAQAAEVAENEARAAAGYGAVHVVGWAQPPTYDTARHHLIWARHIRFEGETTETLNYDLRLLGRTAYLSLNLVATMPELEAVRRDAERLAKAVTFNSGQAYADFQQGDRLASFGVGGLVASGLGVAAAKKLGLLAIIGLFLKKGAVFVFAGAGAAWGWLRAKFGRKPKPPAAGTGPGSES